jgi:MarR family transcriptional regulator for hemolysin
LARIAERIRPISISIPARRLPSTRVRPYHSSIRVLHFKDRPVLEHDLEQSVGCWIALTAHTMRRSLDAELAREGITFRQWEVLASVAFRGEQSQAELAEHLGIEAPTLAGILTRMERDGWLERYNCPHDRRKKRIRIAPRAETVWNRMLECCRRVRTRATEGISDAELARFKTVCDRIRQNLSGDEELEADSECAGALARS